MRRRASLLAASALAASFAACALDPFPLPAGACLTAAECDDGDPCTTDTCGSGLCAHTPVTGGPACSPSPPSPCQGVATDDGDPCTTDACDPSTGTVTHTPVSLCWAPLPTAGAPSPRQAHTAVWTGDTMIVWGGTIAGNPSVTADGASYDPSAQTWTSLPTTGAPPARTGHVAVWTGHRMIVWGGYGVSDYEPGGASYDTVTSTWAPISATGAPSPRTGAAAVWTGSVLLVWGGLHNGGPLGDGATYDPNTDTWTPLPSAGAPSPRFRHTASVTGPLATIWGGYDTVNWMGDGASYDPLAGTWTPLPSTGAPEARERCSSAWTGSQFVVFGGDDPNSFLSTGGALAPVAGTWTALSTSGAPAPRGDATTLWTGTSMLVWGGCGGMVCEPQGDGALWTPGSSGGTWQGVPASAAVAARSAHTAVWTGTRALIWGGKTAAGLTATGGAFTP